MKKEILYLSAVSFLLAFNYFVLKAIKETLLITSAGAGAEAIPFVKMWLLFPVTILFLGLFTYLASRLSLRIAVTSMISFFLFSYALFTFVLFPQRDQLHLNKLADWMLLSLPQGWRAFAAVIRYWSYSFFYVTAECWCTMIYSVVFWGYANAAVGLGDAKRYYPYLTLAGTTAALLAGPITIFLTSTSFRTLIPIGNDRFEGALFVLTGMVIFNGCLALWFFLTRCPAVIQENKPAEKPPFFQSFSKLFRSKYLIALAGMCLTYNLVINLTDVIWKNQILTLYPNPSDYTAYLSYVTIVIGVVSTLLTLFVSRKALFRYGWTKTALITPMIALVTGLVFFVSIFGFELGSSSIPLELIAFFGSLHICLSSAGKYTLFEPTKEMAFIPLSSSDKLHGKAVIDGVGARLGKTTSSMFYQTLLIALPSISACTPYVGIAVLVALAGCIGCVNVLGRQVESQPAT